MLHSGDLLVFGGSMRRMNHCLKCVIPGSFDGCDIRYNLTFRTCNNLTKEEYIAAQTESYNKRRNEEFKKPRKIRKKYYDQFDNNKK